LTSLYVTKRGVRKREERNKGKMYESAICKLREDIMVQRLVVRTLLLNVWQCYSL
jgi:hypothetical protein